MVFICAVTHPHPCVHPYNYNLEINKDFNNSDTPCPLSILSPIRCGLYVSISVLQALPSHADTWAPAPLWACGDLFGGG